MRVYGDSTRFEIRISGEDLYFEAPATIVPRQDFVLQLAPLFGAYMEGAGDLELEQIAIRQRLLQNP